VTAGVATSVVVYQAYQAQRSHEETVARALTEYGAFALWEFEYPWYALIPPMTIALAAAIIHPLE